MCPVTLPVIESFFAPSPWAGHDGGKTAGQFRDRKVHNMLYPTLAFPLLVVITLGYLKIQRTVKRRRRERVLGELMACLCPSCGQGYGSKLRERLTIAEYLWHPAPGTTASSLGLPDETYCVTCPKCGHEAELTTQGKIFKHPQTGVVGFTRTGCLSSS